MVALITTAQPDSLSSALRSKPAIAWRSAWEVSEEVKRGRLVTVLDEFAFPGNNIYAVYPERRLLPAKVKFFIEFLRKTFGDTPYWE